MNFRDYVKFQIETYRAYRKVASIHTFGNLGDYSITTVPGVTVPEYSVNVSNTFMLAKGYVVDIPAICVFVANEIHFYFCNEAFVAIDEKYKTALMEHEAGHLVYKHVSGDTRVILINIIRNITRSFVEPSIEYEADEYASDKVGIACYVEALTYVENLYKNAGLNTSGLRKRIAHLSKKGE